VEKWQDQVWVELVGTIIIARLRGSVTEEMLNERHDRVCQIRQDTGCTRLLLDDLEMNAPSYDAIEAQQVLNTELAALNFHIAVVVPNSRMAYLARLQFGEKNHKVFYNDLAEAILWLNRQAASKSA
jgi:hypothetical protein